MKKAGAVLALGAVVALSVGAAAALRRDTSVPSLPTGLVSRTTFVDFLQLRGEIRPVRSIVLTAPISRAVSSSASRCAMTACLCGIVTFMPRMPSVRIA